MITTMFVATVFADTTEKDAPDPTQKVGTVTSKAKLKSLQEDIINHRLKISAKESKDWAHRISTPLIQEKKREDKLKAQKKAKEKMMVETLVQEKVEFTSSCEGATNQCGIVADYTHFATQNWSGLCRNVFNAWLAKGKETKRGIATVDGYYLVATKPRFGTVGDRINIILEDGTVIKAIQADTKGNEHNNEWGHEFGGGISLVEWELDNSRYSSPDLTNWQGKCVKEIKNLGKYI